MPGHAAFMLIMGMLTGMIGVASAGVVYTNSKRYVFLPFGPPLELADTGKMVAGMLLGVLGTVIATVCGYFLVAPLFW